MFGIGDDQFPDNHGGAASDANCDFLAGLLDIVRGLISITLLHSCCWWLGSKESTQHTAFGWYRATDNRASERYSE